MNPVHEIQTITTALSDWASGGGPNEHDLMSVVEKLREARDLALLVVCGQPVPKGHQPEKMLSTEPFTEVWTTKDGRKLTVGEMSETHVRRALSMVIRRARKREKAERLRARFKQILSMPPGSLEQMSKHDIGFDEFFNGENDDAWGDT